MKIRIFFMCVAMAVAGMLPSFVFQSCSPKVYPTERTDSVRVEIRDSITIHERIVHDTILVSIERDSQSVVVSDTTSTLENDYAVSKASVDKNGRLHHSLDTKPRKMKVPVDIPVKDTLKNHTEISEHSQSETKTIEVNRLTRSQERWIVTGKTSVGVLVSLLVILLAAVAWKIYRKVL